MGRTCCGGIQGSLATAETPFSQSPLFSEAIQAFSSQEISSCERREGPPEGAGGSPSQQNVHTPCVDVTSCGNYLDVPPYPLRGTEREFLRAVGYCHLWISGLAEIAKPLYSSTRGMHPLNWTEVEQQAFEKLKKALVSAPALALPDVTKPFHFYMSEVRGIAKGVLIQTLGPWKRPVAYLSKRLDPVAAGWPTCLRAVATTALLVKEADKQTLGQELALTTPHGVEALLRGAPERWMSNTRITQCQALLLDQPCVRFHKTLAINPASLLPDDNPEEPIQDCTEVTDAVRTARPDLTDVPLSSPDKVLFTLCSGWHPICRAAVVALDRTIWAQSLDRGTTAQKVELLALIQALRWGHSAIHRERGLPTTAGKDIKNKEEILALLEVIWLPRAVAIVHCKGHQKGETIAARGNRAADQTAKEAAQKPMGPLQVLVTLPYLDLHRPPSYTKQEEELAEQKQAIKGPDGWWILPDDRLLVPEALGRT
ncbi:hypothetical protein QTO34_019807 [Cnephaeus nilssonii]|uniref:RNase H type-1 domain-containing protein n=1 Tax=Cnephaeus nilssonii TaxID=3371016 RepID=A0AA40LPB6_CNENI|nr:hypothetical protein QTO34_019807 [Eptesicus nilssonii]